MFTRDKGRPKARQQVPQALALPNTVDLTEAAYEAGFALPFVVTRWVYERWIRWEPADDDKQLPQPQTYRRTAVLRAAYNAAKEALPGVATEVVELPLVPRDGKSRKPTLAQIVMRLKRTAVSGVRYIELSGAHLR